PPASLAARFAAKEAIAKALGAPGGMSWQDCTVERVPGGAPVVHLRDTVAARAAELGVRTWHVSISHDAGIASAMVVAETRPARDRSVGSATWSVPTRSRRSGQPRRRCSRPPHPTS